MDPGADEIRGAGGDDQLFGDEGTDTFVGGPGDDMVDGGSGFDVILIEGTPFDDVIDVAQTADTDLRFIVNNNTQHDTLISGTVEQARIMAEHGADLIRTTIADQLFDDAGLSLQMIVDGGPSTGTGDRLVVVDDGVDDLTVLRKGVTNDAGSVTVGPANVQPLEHVFTGIERLQVVDELGAPLNAGTGNAARLVVFKQDPFEFNDDRFTATLLGANDTINVDPTIDPAGLSDPFGTGFSIPGDSDWYRVDTLTTGTLDVRVRFEEVAAIETRAGLPGNGNLDIELFDADGTLIAGNGEFGDNDGPTELDVDGDGFAEDERIRIPSVAGQTYYLKVFGAIPEVVNNYNITVINSAPPAPFDIELQDTPVGGSSDTGRSRLDNLTRDPTPAIFLRMDDHEFRFDRPGGSPLNTPPDQFIEIPFNTVVGLPGFRVAIFHEGSTPGQPGSSPQTPVGFAQELAGSPGIYSFTFPTPLADGSHFISARVEMTDPATPTHTGFGPRSVSREIVIDTTVPPVSFGNSAVADDGLDPDEGDTGVPGRPELFHDRVTGNTTPAFWGFAEAASIIRVFVDQNADAAVDPGDVLLGTTITVPSGFGQAAPAQWRLQTTVDLNDATLFPRDGVRRLLVTAEGRSRFDQCARATGHFHRHAGASGDTRRRQPASRGRK